MGWFLDLRKKEFGGYFCTHDNTFSKYKYKRDFHPKLECGGPFALPTLILESKWIKRM